MKVKLIPESCSKDLIEEIRTMREKLPVQEWVEYVIEGCSDEEFMDALYYACENGDAMLEDQARYFHELLMNDEAYYYAARMGGFESRN